MSSAHLKRYFFSLESEIFFTWASPATKIRHQSNLNWLKWVNWFQGVEKFQLLFNYYSFQVRHTTFLDLQNEIWITMNQSSYYQLYKYTNNNRQSMIINCTSR
ncbi:hypothetical protein O6H91_15G079000 [Diphasiastrum complanatum]|uniref:Uncharacterized protein n=1 Tax=Diphasiastrum complanatum TaxID=34168 RepID=A0ACC2BK41_DIPCM|nr:hypothetical protein O6H91_15G079000 [Diphasiastrum complanatum]